MPDADLESQAFRHEIDVLPYQSILSLAQSLSEHPSEWNRLATWFADKIITVAAQAAHEGPLNRGRK